MEIQRPESPVHLFAFLRLGLKDLSFIIHSISQICAAHKPSIGSRLQRSVQIDFSSTETGCDLRVGRLLLMPFVEEIRDDYCSFSLVAFCFMGLVTIKKVSATLSLLSGCALS